MPDKKELEAPLPADVAREDSVGGMARRLLDPAHIKQVAAWCARPEMDRAIRTLRPEGLSRRKALVAALLRGRHYRLLQWLYQVKNR